MAYKFKLNEEFVPPAKVVPILKAYDKKPALKLYQGVIGKQN